MTRDADFKHLVRARMAETGQPYTAARADLLREDGGAAGPDRAPDTAAPPDEDFERARRVQERTVGRFIVDGRMVNVPMRRKARAAVLLHLVALFEARRTYSEAEVNQVLSAVHDDFAFWRRELVDYGYLERSEGRYRLAARAPERTGQQWQEFGDWERLWLPDHLAGRDAARR